MRIDGQDGQRQGIGKNIEASGQIDMKSFMWALFGKGAVINVTAVRGLFGENMKENKKLMLSAKILLVTVILLFVGIIAYVLTPVILSSMLGVDVASVSTGTYSGSGPKALTSGVNELNSMVSQLLAVVIFLLLCVSGPVYLITLVLAAIEIVNSNRGNGWKVPWILVCVVLGAIGVLAYVYEGRKAL